MIDSPYQPLYNDAGNSTQIDPLFLRAQAIVESSERPNAVSPAGAQGISQFMPKTALTAGPNGTPINPIQPEQAIPAQARMMNDLLTKYTDKNGNPDAATALMEYHGGPDRSIWGPKTAAYPGKVATVYAQLRQAQAQQTAPASAATASPPALSNADMIKQMHADSAPADSSANAAMVRQMQTEVAPNPQTMRVFRRGAEPPSSEKAENWGIPEPPKPSTSPPPIAPGPSVPDPIAVAGNALTAYQHAMDNPGNLLGPEGQKWMDANAPGVSKYVMPTVNTATAIPGALFSGAQAGVATAGNSLSPGLGRDLAAGMEVMPMLTHAEMGPGKPYEGKAPTPGWIAATDKAPASEGSRPAPSVAAAGSPSGSPASPASPGNLGAAATTSPIPAQTAAAEKADFIRQSRQSTTDRAQPSSSVGTDGRTYATRTDTGVDLPDVRPLLGSVHYDPQIAIDTKALMAKYPEFKAKVIERQTENNHAIVDAANNLAQDPNALKRLTDERDLVKPNFAGEKPVDVNPLVQQIDQLLASGDGKRQAIRTALTDVRKSLYDDNGNLETLPSQLYGARGNIADKLNSAANALDSESSTNRIASFHLHGLLDAADNLISGKDISGSSSVANAGAPAYEKYMSDYHRLSGPIDAMTYLQKNLTGPGKIVNGAMTLAKVQSVLDDIERYRWEGGVDATKRLSPEQIQGIFAIRNALQRERWGRDIGATSGSDTVQQLMALQRQDDIPSPAAVVAKGVGTMALHGALAATTHGVGNMLLRGGEVVGGGISAARKANKARAAAEMIQQMQDRILSSHPNWEGAAY